MLSWLESYSEVGATLVVYRVPVTRGRRLTAARHNVTLHTATCHDAILALYHCARARWLATSGDSCQCMTGIDDFLSTLSRVRPTLFALTLIANITTLNHLLALLAFYNASALLAIQAAVIARGIPSVCPSRSGIVSRRMKIRSCGFQHLV